MPRFKLAIEYEGTRYSGWQRQQQARTIQGAIDDAIRDTCGTHRFELYGAGRTDAGVHALRQIAHLDIQTSLAPDILRFKLNDALPADINILSVERSHPVFHARHDAVARSYLYQICRRRTAFGKRYVWWVKDTLDAAAISNALQSSIGRHDFAAFTDDDPEEKSTKVEIEQIAVKESGALILVRIVGSHFVWKLVRRLVGVAVEVGRGRLSVNDMQSMLAGSSDEVARFTAPPSGLFLERVYYKHDVRLESLEPVLHIGA